MGGIANMIKTGDMNKYTKNDKSKDNAYIHELNYPAEAIGYDGSSHAGAVELQNVCITGLYRGENLANSNLIAPAGVDHHVYLF